MTATISVKETIGKKFDNFYTECEFKNIELSAELKRLLWILEGDVYTEAESEYTTEYHLTWEEGYKEGVIDSQNDVYEEGFTRGYEKAVTDSEKV